MQRAQLVLRVNEETEYGYRCELAMLFEPFITHCVLLKGLPGNEGPPGDPGSRGDPVSASIIKHDLCIDQM